MSPRTFSASALVLSPLKAASFLLVVIALAIVITSCSPAEPEKNEVGEQASSAFVASSESQKAPAEAVASSVSSVAPPKSQPAVNKTNWQTYKNAQYGFLFQYPSNWKFAIMSGADLYDAHILGSYEVTPPGFLGGPEYLVQVTDRSLQEEVEKESKDILQGGTTEIVSTIQVARYGQQGKRITYRHKTVGSVYSVYFFTYDGRTYQLTGEKGMNSDAFAPTITRIAESFQFLPLTNE